MSDELLSPKELAERWRTPTGLELRRSLLEGLAKGDDGWRDLPDSLPGSNELQENKDLRGIDLTGVELPPNLDFSFCSLDHVVLDGRNLRKTSFSNADLNYVSFRGADLTGSCFNGAHLRYCRFDGCNLSNTRIDPWDMRGARFTGANMRQCSIHTVRPFEVDLRGADLRDSQLTGIKSPRCLIEGANFTGARIHIQGQGVDWEGTPEQLQGDTAWVPEQFPPAPGYWHMTPESFGQMLPLARTGLADLIDRYCFKLSARHCGFGLDSPHAHVELLFTLDGGLEYKTFVRAGNSDWIFAWHIELLRNGFKLQRRHISDPIAFTGDRGKLQEEFFHTQRQLMDCCGDIFEGHKPDFLDRKWYDRFERFLRFSYSYSRRCAAPKPMDVSYSTGDWSWVMEPWEREQRGENPFPDMPELVKLRKQ